MILSISRDGSWQKPVIRTQISPISQDSYVELMNLVDENVKKALGLSLQEINREGRQLSSGQVKMVARENGEDYALDPSWFQDRHIKYQDYRKEVIRRLLEKR